MELKEWELKELERIRQARKDLETLYYESPTAKERGELLQAMKDSGENPERVAVIEELYNHRYEKRKGDLDHVDYAIRGWVNINFLAEMSKGIFTKKKIPKKVEEICEDMGKHICGKYGDLGREIWKKEAFNIVRVYIYLCKTDKAYGSVLFGIGRMKKGRLERKICYDIVKITHVIPRDLGLTDFEDLKDAAREAFKFEYPDSGNLFDVIIDKCDGKETILDAEDDV